MGTPPVTDPDDWPAPVPDRTSGLWKMVGFEEALDRWADLETPPSHIPFIVTNWLLGQMSDPFGGMRREQQIPDLWFGTVPGSRYGGGSGQAVACSYFVDAQARTVRCDQIATLNLPIV